MLLTENNIMNQPQETGLTQEAYLERLLQQQRQQQYQQKFQQQFPGERSGHENFSDTLDINVNNNEGIFMGRSSGNVSFASGNNGTKSPPMAISNSMGIGINQQQQQQQNRMMTFLQERQQQQQFMTGSMVGGPSDLSPNLGISGLSSNVGLDSRVGNSGIGSGISSSAWMDGFGTGSMGNSNASIYSTEQDLFLGSQRFPSLGGSIGGNRLNMNGEGTGSYADSHLSSLLGGLPQFCLPHQTLPSAQASLNAQQKNNRKSFTDILLAKQAQAALLQAAQAHLPRTIRLPCGARGMKADHNSSTAYFDVPENARHGQHLLCSHSVCRAAGVKFRYCFYCKKPVTKQNFRSRHLHADLDPNNKKKDEKEVDRKKKKNKDNEEPKRKISSETRKSVEVKKEPVADDDDKDSIESLAAVPITDSGSLERPLKIRKLAILDGGETCLLRNRWEKLLEEHPSDDDKAIHSWAEKVLQVSYPGIDSSGLGSIDILKLQKEQEQEFHPDNLTSEGLSGRWNSLLDRRPKEEDSTSSSVTNWLIQALELANKYKKVNN